jgi:hypothetical protein
VIASSVRIYELGHGSTHALLFCAERSLNMANKKHGFNECISDGDVTIIICKKRNGEVHHVLIDTEDLEKIKKEVSHIAASWYPEIEGYYAAATRYLGMKNGKPKYKTLLIHNLIMQPDKGQVVDHIESKKTLDNRKSNLRVAEACNNSSNRKGANKNSGTGHRNVNYGSYKREYLVQFCRRGERFKYVFPLSQFQEACDFADMKRVELFGEFAGNP